MIKYLGSKRRLVPVLGELCERAGARTALDLFTGTTRVAQEFKRRGARVWAVDSARYSEALARCYVATDERAVDEAALAAALARLGALPGRDGYVTETFCRRARYLQPHNGRRIDAIRDAWPPSTRTRRCTRSCSRACSRRPIGWTPRPACRWPT